MTEKKWTCRTCGSDVVQLAMWVKPNTGEVLEPLFDHVVPKVTAFWCDDCNTEREVDRGDRPMKAPRKLKASEVVVRLEVKPEDVSVSGSFASGEPERDREQEREVLARLNRGDEWAWFCAKVTVSWGSFSATEHLGCCSYASEEDFKKGGYYDDMVTNALEELNQQVAAAWTEIAKLTA